LALGSLQHGQLMTQREDLGLQCKSTPKAKEQGIDERHYANIVEAG
jgi:hypothetical protein